ncbi:MAG: FAD-dependent oxidoreductase [Mycobacteriales bacterium]
MSDRVVVVGGGPGGLRAAQGLAELGVRVLLVEQRAELGGMPIAEHYAGLTPFGEPAEPAIRRIVDAVQAHDLVDVRLSSEVVAVAGDAGDFALTVRSPQGQETESVGAAVLATGFQHFDPGRETQMYGYYEFPDVIALQDLEAMLKEHHVVRPSNGEPPSRVCFIQCVGSRDRHIGNEYCSKVCCGVASKEAIEVRELLPDSKVFIFYIDMRMYGYWENQIYWPAQEKHHVQYVKGIITEVLPMGDRLVVRGEDTTMGRPMELLMDLVVLSVGMEPSVGTRESAKLFGVRQNKFGFIEAVGSPLDPVSTSRAGVWACGAALGPADLEDSVSSGANAAMKAAAFLRSRTPVAS